jgi:hypothetical protein
MDYDSKLARVRDPVLKIMRSGGLRAKTTKQLGLLGEKIIRPEHEQRPRSPVNVHIENPILSMVHLNAIGPQDTNRNQVVCFLQAPQGE